MARRSKRDTKRLTPAQEREVERLRELCARITHRTGQTDTVHHEQLRALLAVEKIEPEEIYDGTSDEDTVLAGQHDGRIN